MKKFENEKICFFSKIVFFIFKDDILKKNEIFHEKIFFHFQNENCCQKKKFRKKIELLYRCRILSGIHFWQLEIHPSTLAGHTDTNVFWSLNCYQYFDQFYCSGCWILARLGEPGLLDPKSAHFWQKASTSRR